MEVLNGLLARRGREPITEEVYRLNFGFPVIRFYEFLGFDTDTDSLKKVSKEFIGDYEDRWLEECALHQDAQRILADLSARGFTHSILSAAKQEALEIGIGHFGIRSTSPTYAGQIISTRMARSRPDASGSSGSSLTWIPGRARR